MKKILVVSALALGLSSVALAGGIAEPVAAAPVATAAVSSTGFNPGIYVGIQGGWADSGLKALDGVEVIGSNGTITTSTTKDTGWGGRAFVGYQFHKNFAVEAGYFMMRKATLGYNFGNQTTGFVPRTGYSTDVKTQAFDLMFKGILPVTDEFSFFAKAGPAYLMNSWTFSSLAAAYSASTGLIPASYGSNSNRLTVAYGLGAAYTINNWGIDLSWTRWNSGERNFNSDKWQPSVDLYALGVSYKFDL